MGTEAEGLLLDAAVSEPVIEFRYLVQVRKPGHRGLRGWRPPPSWLAQSRDSSLGIHV